MSSDGARRLGVFGEEHVTRFLKGRGYRIVARNYAAVVGEVDIIARYADVLAFVEVKLRKNIFFPMEEIITLDKQRRIVKTAQHFLMTRGEGARTVRFDVVFLYFDGSAPQVQYHEHAFEATSDR